MYTIDSGNDCYDVGAAAIKQTADSQLGESYEETMAAVQSEEAATKERKPQPKPRNWIIPERVDQVFYSLGDAPGRADRV